MVKWRVFRQTCFHNMQHQKLKTKLWTLTGNLNDTADNETWEKEMFSIFSNANIFEEEDVALLTELTEKALLKDEAIQRPGFGRVIKGLMDLTPDFETVCEEIWGDEELEEIVEDLESYDEEEPLAVYGSIWSDSTALEQVGDCHWYTMDFCARALTNDAAFQREDFSEVLTYVLEEAEKRLGNPDMGHYEFFETLFEHPLMLERKDYLTLFVHVINCGMTEIKFMNLQSDLATISDDQTWEEKVIRVIDRFDIWQNYIGALFFEQMERALWNEEAPKRAGFGKVLKRLMDLTVSFPEACEVLLGERHEVYREIYHGPVDGAAYLKGVKPFGPVNICIKALSHKTAMNRPDFPELLIYVFEEIKTKLGNEIKKIYYYNSAVELFQNEAFKSRKDSQELINAVKELHPNLEI